MDISDIVARRRRELNWSQTRLGDAVGVTAQTILNFEKGHTGKGIGSKTLGDIFDMLGLVVTAMTSDDIIKAIQTHE